MYNLLEYSNNYSFTSGNLWNYYRDEVNDTAIETVANYKLNNKTTTCKSYEYKTQIIGATPININRLYIEVAVPLKLLSNFWKSFDLHLFNCKTEFDLS